MANVTKIDLCTLREDVVRELIFNNYDSSDDLDDDGDELPTDVPIHTERNSQNLNNIQIIDNEDEDVLESSAIISTAIDSFPSLGEKENGNISGNSSSISTAIDSDSSGQPASLHTDSWSSFPYKFRNVIIDPKSMALQKILWKKQNLVYHEEEIKFRGDCAIPAIVQELQTPFQVWSLLFPESLEKTIVEETIKYSGQNESFQFDVPDLRKFIGILFYMTYHNLPNVRDYWSDKNHRCVNIIKQQMSRNRFEKIRQYIHFNDKSKAPTREDPNHDRLFLLRPVIDELNSTFGSIPKLERLCVDEQMCSSKIGHFMKQYLPNKPKKWGFKFFNLYDTMGFAYKFEIYTGVSEEPAQDEPDLQSCANIVVRLVREVPSFQNYIIYFDNYYTTVPLLLYLRTRGILSIGTIRRNRIKNCKLPEEKVMMKFERGTSREYVASIYGIDVTSLSWKDNRIVNLISTYVGTKPFSNNQQLPPPLTVKRFDKKEKKVKMVPCPQIIKDYNCHMGGVDLMDSLMGRHKIHMKSRKWTNRIFYHLLDMTCVNAWVLYKRTNSWKPDYKYMRLIDFKLEIADTLFSYKSIQAITRGRPSLESQIQAKRKKPNATSAPPRDTRLDMTDHWVILNSKGRCKYPGCSGQTKMYCTKCYVNLCLTAEKNCFFKYHHN